MTHQLAGPPRGILNTTPVPGEHKRLLPCEPLREYLEHFWIVSWDLRGMPPRIVETLPHPAVHLTVESDRPCTIGGVYSGRFSRELSGEGRVFGVKFRPGGFYPFWQQSLSNLRDQTLPVADVFGDAGEQLANAIMLEADDESRITLAESFLLARMPSADANLSKIRLIVEHIVNDPQINRVEQIVTLSGLSLRSLQRLFKDYVGISPKWMIQRYRMHEALQRLNIQMDIDWSEFALSLGYFDQAHFIKDFKTLVGKTPRQYQFISRSEAN